MAVITQYTDDSELPCVFLAKTKSKTVRLVYRTSCAENNMTLSVIKHVEHNIWITIFFSKWFCTRTLSRCWPPFDWQIPTTHSQTHSSSWPHSWILALAHLLIPYFSVSSDLSLLLRFYYYYNRQVFITSDVILFITGNKVIWQTSLDLVRYSNSGIFVNKDLSFEMASLAWSGHRIPGCLSKSWKPRSAHGYSYTCFTLHCFLLLSKCLKGACLFYSNNLKGF